MRQFEEQLRAYRRYHLQPAEDLSTRDDREAASLVAWHTFQAAFSNQPTLTEAYLLQREERTLLDDISSWIDQCAPQGYRQGPGEQNMRSETVANLEACSALLMQLTSESSDGNAAAGWPYIQRVKYETQLVAN